MLRFLPILGLSIAAGCATHDSYSSYADIANARERKAYIACAVTQAFSRADTRMSSMDIARRAIGECGPERAAVVGSLVAEGSRQPLPAQLVDAYMDELEKTMLDHIAMRLSQARESRRGSSGA